MPDKTVQVAVGLLLAPDRRVLIARRHPDAHLGGLWEFPGGKVNTGETVQSALRRELLEELGIEVRRAFPLCRIKHDYPDKSVLLEVWQVAEYDGEPTGMEGQPVAWQPVQALSPGDFPAANLPIIRLARFPTEIAITPTLRDIGELRDYLLHVRQLGVECVQLRQKQLDATIYTAWYARARDFARSHGIKLLFNHDEVHSPPVTIDGLHASSQRAMALDRRPVSSEQWFSVACHNSDELRRAERLGADFAVLSPVLATATHPGAAALDWSGFAALRAGINLPVFALGGLSRSDLERANRAGAFGIAGIRAYSAGWTAKAKADLIEPDKG